MENQNKKVALLVHSCDRYEFLFEGFYYFFSKNWDYNIPCNYYFATEEKNAVFPGFTNIKSGKGEWSNRLIHLLKEKIKEDYILYIQEDMWLNKKVNAIFFKELFELAFENNWEQIKLHSSAVYKTSPTLDYIEGFNITRVNNFDSKFLMSHQVTLWEKKYFLNQLFENESARINEVKATQRLREANPEIFHIDYFAENGNREINSNKNPVARSEYQTVSINSYLYRNVIPFINELMKGSKQQKKYAKALKRHYILQLTHDRKDRPYSEPLLMDIKIWLKSLRPRLSYLIFGKLK